MHLICPPKFCIAFVFHFSWVLQPSLPSHAGVFRGARFSSHPRQAPLETPAWEVKPSQEKLKTMLMQNFGEKIRCIMGNVEVTYSQRGKAARLGGQRIGLAIRRSWVRVLRWPLAEFVLGRPKIKSSTTLVNSQLVTFRHLGFLILLCSIRIILFQNYLCGSVPLWLDKLSAPSTINKPLAFKCYRSVVKITTVFSFTKHLNAFSCHFLCQVM